MKTVALNTLCVEAARKWQQLGYARHGTVKRRVEAGHLGQLRMTLAECLDQLDLAWQMIRVVRPDAMQLIQQALAHDLGLDVLHPMDDAMAHGLDCGQCVLLFEPVNQNISRRPVIGGCDIQSALLRRGRAAEGQIGAAQADAIDLPIEPALQRFGDLVQHEPDARRAAIDGEDQSAPQLPHCAQERKNTFPAQHTQDVLILCDGQPVDSVAVHFLERGPELGVSAGAFQLVHG